MGQINFLTSVECVCGALQHGMQALYPAAGNSGVLLPVVAADKGPQVPGVGLADGAGAGQRLQG